MRSPQLARSPTPTPSSHRPRRRGGPARRLRRGAPPRRRDDRVRPRPRGVLRAAGPRRPLRADLGDGRRRRRGAGPPRARRRADLARHRRPGARRGRGGRARSGSRIRSTPPPPRGHRQARAARAPSTAPACRSRPRARTGRGCRRARARRQAGRGAGPARARDRRARRRPGGGARGGARGLARRSALCEEFVEGPELTVNAFLDDGACRAHRDRPRARRWPSASPPRTSTRAPRRPARSAAVAEAACSALGLREGPTYTQVLLAPDGPRVMEVAARLGGGHDAELCEAALGVDLSAAAVRAALGREPGRLDAVARPRGRRALPDRAAGRLARVDGLEDAARCPASSSPTPTARPAR